MPLLILENLAKSVPSCDSAIRRIVYLGIDQDEDKPQPLEDRGAIYILLHEYEDALRDYEKAIKVHAASGKGVYGSNKAFIGAARAQILDGDIRAAAKTLDESSLSTLQLRSLGADPDFLPLVESEKYNEVLRLK